MTERSLHKRVGAELIETVRVQVLASPQHISMAIQVWVMTMLHGAGLLVVLLRSVTATAVQQESTYGGGWV